MSTLATVTPADVVAEARTWIGTSFMHQARVRGVGVDCVGLVIGVARALGLVEPTLDITGYPRSPDGRSMLAVCDQHMRRVDAPALGCVLVVRHEIDPQHMGIVGDYVHGGLSLIHALGTRDGRGRVVEHRLDESTLARLIAVYALPGVE